MARKRMIDPDFWTDEKLGLCKRDERLFFMGLISNADDEGRGRGNLKLLKATIFPYDEDIKVKDMEQMVCSLMSKGMAYFYVVDGQDFYYLPNFLKHQTINKPTTSNLPEMPINSAEVVLPEYYRSATGSLPPNRREVKLSKEKRIESNPAHTNKELFLEYVYLTPDEHERLISEFGEADTSRMIEILDSYIGQNPKKNDRYTDHNRVIRNWVKDRLAEEKSKQGKSMPVRSTADQNSKVLEELLSG